MMVSLVIGLSGCGKTTKAKELIGDDGLCYDMDAVASAFRLRDIHEEYCPFAREMANDFLYGFLSYVGEYTDNIVIIRTAPSIEELEDICPDKLYVMQDRYVVRDMDDEDSALDRIDEAIEWAKANNVEVESTNRG
jgi:hypothetical protein